MRIVLVNKFFYPHAGAESVYFDSRELLQAKGHEVVDFGMKSSKNVSSPYAEYFAKERQYVSVTSSTKAKNAVASIYDRAASARFEALLGRYKPDLVHFHNIYHQLSLSLVDAAHRSDVPSVMTLHDYKIACPSYSLFRDGKRCGECVRGDIFNVVRHRCIKGSLPASVAAYAEALLAKRRGTYGRVARLIAPSAFVGRVAEESGYPSDRIDIVTNFISDRDMRKAPASASIREAPSFVFAGRLDEVKGVRDVAQLFADGRVSGSLVVVGDGPQLAELQGLAATSDHITVLGRRSREEVALELGRARAALVPSRWQENCPMSVLEARAAGTAVICSDSGGMPDMVDDGVDGLVVPAADADRWAAAIERLAQEPALAQRFADRGLVRLRADHSADTHYARLMDSYELAMSA